MFASNPFGQSSSSPFGSQPAFGQANNANNNPFAAKPFGSTSAAGGSIFGGTSTGVFGANQSPSPAPAFGASHTPPFGASPTPAFGASSTPAFGNSFSSSAFGGSSLFGQKPAFGGFSAATPTQTSPFGGTFQQPQPVFGVPSQPAFGASNTPAFGSTSNSTFGATGIAGFGSTSTPAFGSNSNPTFGNTGSAFGTSNTSVFGASSAPAFGASSAPAFGASLSTPAFGAATTPVFGASNTSAFGASSSSGFTFGSNPAFSQSTASPFGAQSSSFGGQTGTFGSNTFGQSSFAGQRGGSRVASYTPTTEVDSSTGTQAGKLSSISAMNAYKEKSHEELRWEDYQLGDKGGPAPSGQSSGITSLGMSNTQSNPFGASPSFAQPAANSFPATSTNPFAPKTSPFGTSAFGNPSSGGFGNSTVSNPFGATSSQTTSIFGAATTPFGTNSTSSIFGTPNSSGFGQASSVFGATPTPGSSPSFGTGVGFSNTQSSPLFQSTTPSIGQTVSAFGQATNPSLFGQPSNTSPFGQTTNVNPFGQNANTFGQPSLFNTPSTGFGANFSSTPPLLSSTNPGFFSQTPSQSTPFQSAQPQTSAFGFGNFGQTQAPGIGGIGGGSTLFGQGTFGQMPVTQSSAVVQLAPAANPFGTLPAMPQVSIGQAGTTPSIQYGISSIPVVEKPAPVRISSLLTTRHLSQRRMRLPVRKYNPKNNGPKVPFFCDDEETTTPKADALFIPRENPRALVIRPMEQWPLRASADQRSPLKDIHTPVYDNGNVVENGIRKERDLTPKLSERSNGIDGDHPIQNDDSYISLTGHRAGEAAIVYEHGADIEALMPKLRHSDYFIEPRIQELASKERAEPGFCRHVNDFVVGRHGFGSIKFMGETDVRRLDLESLIQFNDREVIVYMDDSKKPPVGQGLNKPAEVTLLNIKCFDKKSGSQYTQGPRIEKYKDMLRRKAENQGAKFVSYEPVKGEWKFMVNHFSKYEFGNDEDEPACPF